MAGELAAETERLTGLLAEVSASRRRHRDHTRRDLRDALREVLAAMTVYRPYVVPGQEPSATSSAARRVGKGCVRKSRSGRSLDPSQTQQRQHTHLPNSTT